MHRAAVAVGQTPPAMRSRASRQDRDAIPEGVERAMEAMLKMGKVDVAELERAYRG